jgi:succinyl-diaminopimelate desuccinylase
VVGVGDLHEWSHDPFAADVVDGVMWGRGPADSKGMLAGMIAAVRAFTGTGLRPRGDLYLVAYVDDETAGPMGLRHVFDRGLVSAENLVLGEATGFEVQHLFKGRIWFGVDVVGRSAHGAFPERGVNAIDRAYAVIQNVRAIPLFEHPMLGRDTVSVGMIRGGEQVNVVCGRCRVWFDIRWGPPRTSLDIRREVQGAVQRTCAETGDFEVGELDVSEERDPLEFPAESPLVSAIEDAGRSVLDREVGLGGWYSSGELWPVWRAGHIRHGAVIGPGEPWQAHAIDEHIEVSDLVDGARVYALTALNVCGVARR